MPTITAREAPPNITTRSMTPPAAQPKAVAAPEPVVAPVAETVDTSQSELSPKFAALAKKEKELRRIQQQLQAERQSLKTEADKYKSEYISKSKLSEDPISVLLENGYSVDQIAQRLLNQQQNPQDQAMRALQAELKAVKDAQTQAVEEQRKQQSTQYEQALNQIRVDAKALIESDANYETIKESGAVEAVVELIKTRFETDQTLLSIEQAAKEVEDYLIEEAIKVTKYNKVKAKLKALADEEMQKAAAIAPQKKPQQINQIKTLTNAATSSPSKALTAKDRRERAILAFKNQLT